MRQLLVLFAVALIALIAVQPVHAQVSFQKWDMYAGYTYLHTPTMDLSQHGYNLSFGRNINHWLALGMDFSHFNGSGIQTAPLTPSLSLNVPYDASTTTFAAGTQFQVRKVKWVTPFFRPFLGAFHTKAKGKPSQIQLPPGVPSAILGMIPASELTKSDTILGYGAGGGIDINLSAPIGLRVSTDYIRTSLFDQKQNNVRVSFGLIYRFGGEMGGK